MSKDSRALSRFVMVLNWYQREWVAERGTDRGWQTALAKKTGLAQPYISKLSRGERGGELGFATVAKLCEGLRLPLRFFVAPVVGADVSAYVGKRDEDVDTSGRAVTQEWLESPSGVGVSPEHRRLLLSIDWGDVPVTPALLERVWSQILADEARAAGTRAHSTVRPKRGWRLLKESLARRDADRSGGGTRS